MVGRLGSFLRGAAVAGALLVGAFVLAEGTALADLPAGAVWTATINDRNVETATASDPVRLEPGTPARIAVRVENRGAQAVSARYIRLEGKVLGLSFYVYTTRVDLEVPPGGVGDPEFDVDLLDLGRQAAGLIPSRLSLLDAAGSEIAGKDLQVDVRGDLNSVYSTFGIAIGLLTVVLLGSALWRLATGRLHPNRWRRALTLAAPGLGLGFVITFSLSALRLASPQATLWAVLLVAGAAAGFTAGYLSPTPSGPDGPDPAGRHPAPLYEDDATDPRLDLRDLGHAEESGSR